MMLSNEMSSKQHAVNILKELNKQSFDYALIRNYDFLFEGTPGKDIDIIIKEESVYNVKNFFISKNFVEQKICPFSKHFGFYKVFPEENKVLKFHFHVGGISGSYSEYLSQDILLRKKMIKGIPVISDEDLLISMIFHSKLGSKGEEKYRKKVEEILCKDFDKKYVKKKLNNILLNEELTQKVLSLLYTHKFEELDKIKKNITRAFISKKLLPVLKIKFFCTVWKVKQLLKKPRVISFTGMDGAGKTTLTKEIKTFFENNKIPVKIVYTGRGKNNLLPIQKIGKPYKRFEKKIKLNKTITRIIYSFSSFFFFLDSLLRYFFIIFPSKFKNEIIITDRYGSDILLMENVPKVLKIFYYKLLPKPMLTFYIFNSIKVLHKRKPNHPYSDLERQEKLFNWVNAKVNPLFIKNNVLKDSKNLIIKKIFENIRL